jgi:hypothetical protein
VRQDRNQARSITECGGSADSHAEKGGSHAGASSRTSICPTTRTRKIPRHSHKRKLEHLYDEFLQMAEFDVLSTQPRYSTALLVAFRPWVFSLVAARQRRAPIRGANVKTTSRRSP